jgi:serine/threonine protein kinase
MAAYSGVIVIGHGPCATVYGAVETESGRPVALKVFNARADGADAIIRDVRGLARLRPHPNIVVPDRIGSTEDGHPVTVSDLQRTSMKRVIDEDGPADARMVTDVGVKIAGALAEAHERGLLHLNLKPQNILVTLMEEPALADFGLFSFRTSVRSMADRSPFSAFHAPPEMFEDGELSPATDVYNLASTMYQLLSGRAPFEPFGAESAASIVLRILRDPVTPLSSTAMPYRLTQLVEAGLAKDPGERPPSASAFADELRTISAEEGWSAAVPESRRGRGVGRGSPDSSETRSDTSSGAELGVPTRRGVPRVAPPGTPDRNVILPEGGRRGSMDRPPRRS